MAAVYGGNIFKMTPTGVLTTLYSFSEAVGVFTGLVQASDGDFYGTTYQGGANGEGIIFKITTGGAFTTIYSFAGAQGLSAIPGFALVQGADGNLYGTTSDTCAPCETIYRVTPSGAFTTLYSFNGTQGLT